MRSSAALALALAFSAPPLRAAPAVVAPRELNFCVEPPAQIAPLVMPPQALGLESVSWFNNYAAIAGVPLKLLGRGLYGVAYVHPADDALMVKVAAIGFGNAQPRGSKVMQREIIEEADSARALAEIGAGPKLIGVTRIQHRMQPLVDRMAAWFGVRGPDWGQPAVVKEKVEGKTVGDLRRAGEFTPEDQRMIQELRARIRAAGLLARDLHDENIMIGATVSDPEPRAYLVDAGFVRSL